MAPAVRIGHDQTVAIFPKKLVPGSCLRVIAPARSLDIIGADVQAEADRRLGGLGFKVSFGSHVGVCDDFSSSPDEDRLADLHAGRTGKA